MRSDPPTPACNITACFGILGFGSCVTLTGPSLDPCVAALRTTFARAPDARTSLTIGEAEGGILC